MTPSAQKNPDCADCTHYYITHNASFPCGCRALNFKSKRKPYLDVLDASGNPCMAYEQRRENNKNHISRLPGNQGS